MVLSNKKEVFHMLKQRSELEHYLNSKCESIALNKDLCKEITMYLNAKYEIPTGTVMDMIVRGKLKEQTEQVLFYLLDGIHFSKKEKEKYFKEFYTDIEIRKYLTSKIEVNKIKMPIRIGCFQVAEDQWIGHTDSTFFMRLRAAQLINYNENTQRALTRVNTKNGGEIFKITLNEGAVKAIRACYKEEVYIPTPITLNIPTETDADFYYDEECNELVINSFEHFDILDGYHRYIAMCRECDENPDFVCQWELRIVNFTEAKAKLFIFQEDQKTKMKKADSRTMNSRSPVNKAVVRLNEDSGFELAGEINATGGNLPKTPFSIAFEHFYFKGCTKSNENLIVRQAVQDVKKKFNALIELNETYLTKKYTYAELVCLFYLFSQTENAAEIEKLFPLMMTKVEELDARKLSMSRGISKILEKDLGEIYREVL